MQRFLTRAARFIESEDGPTAVEYAVMLSLILVACIAAVRSFGTATFSSLTRTANSLAS